MQALTPKQIRILKALAVAPDWMTRKQMEPIAGRKGYSEALGTPTTGLRPDCLESRGLVMRKDDHTPYQYRIAASGLAALRELGIAVPTIDQAERLIPAGDLDLQLSEAVRRARTDSRAERRRRLALAPRIPDTVAVWSVAYRRNPDVVAEVLERASGTCEICGASAPFSRRSDGTPYLEVHHRKTLAEGGEDTVENAVAVCPNCHRRAHFG